MLGLTFNSSEPSCVLLLGAHCDDIEIGCGATLLQLVERWPRTRYVWVTLSSDAERAAETALAASRLLEGASEPIIQIESFRGSFFPYDGALIKEYLESLKVHQPELILTHYRHDLHQDHRVTSELTWNTFRDHLILEYEIPKFDGDLGLPNTYVPMGMSHLQRKVQVLLDCYPSQRYRRWFTRSTFEAIARLRGIECNAPEGYAEAFYCRKGCLCW